MPSQRSIARKQLAEVYEQFRSTYQPGPATQFCIQGCKLGAFSPYDSGGRIQSLKSACPCCRSFIKALRKNCTERIAVLILEYKPFRCDYCGGSKFDRKFGQTWARCWICRKGKELTATVQFFHRVKTPEDRLFYFVALRSGIDFNAKQFSDTLRKSSNTGIELERKINVNVLYRLKSENRLALAPLVEFMRIFDTRQPLTEFGASRKSRRTSSLPESEERLYSAIKTDPVPIETLIHSLGMPIGNVLAGLSVLELDGLIVCLPGSLVARV
ncbi:MAG: hypothetical protein KGS72_08910 [Cyanobacteria bacterium REEB67]|nr:hypothetical protein [Cyanobacteria bacterium REEB67]